MPPNLRQKSHGYDADNATLHGANLSTADLTKANLLGVTFRQTILPDGSMRNP